MCPDFSGDAGTPPGSPCASTDDCASYLTVPQDPRSETGTFRLARVCSKGEIVDACHSPVGCVSSPNSILGQDYPLCVNCEGPSNQPAIFADTVDGFNYYCPEDHLVFDRVGKSCSRLYGLKQ
jgi:hypothetical protein